MDRLAARLRYEVKRFVRHTTLTPISNGTKPPSERQRKATMTSTVRRRRAVLLNADAVGYSRIMAGDDLAALAMLLDSFTLIARCVARHHGRIVNDAGDNVLAELPNE